MTDLIPTESIAIRIFFIRGHKVMLDRDLAVLYGVKTKALKQAVRRNISRFPDDFMFELSKEDKTGLRYAPMAVTEQGVAMLSTVLKSERAIDVNIAIMRAFVKMRQMLATHADLKRKIEEMEAKYDEQFQVVFEAIRQLLEEDEKPKRKIGF